VAVVKGSLIAVYEKSYDKIYVHGLFKGVQTEWISSQYSTGTISYVQYPTLSLFPFIKFHFFVHVPNHQKRTKNNLSLSTEFCVKTTFGGVCFVKRT